MYTGTAGRLVHQSYFVTTASSPTPGNSVDKGFLSITTLLKALHFGDKLKLIALSDSPNTTAERVRSLTRVTVVQLKFDRTVSSLVIT